MTGFVVTMTFLGRVIIDYVSISCFLLAFEILWPKMVSLRPSEINVLIFIFIFRCKDHVLLLLMIFVLV